MIKLRIGDLVAYSEFDGYEYAYGIVLKIDSDGTNANVLFWDNYHCPESWFFSEELTLIQHANTCKLE